MTFKVPNHSIHELPEPWWSFTMLFSYSWAAAAIHRHQLSLWILPMANSRFISYTFQVTPLILTHSTFLAIYGVKVFMLLWAIQLNNWLITNYWAFVTQEYLSYSSYRLSKSFLPTARLRNTYPVAATWKKYIFLIYFRTAAVLDNIFG